MKYSKLLTKIFAKKSDHTAQVVVAVAAGLAVGAVISILFAPKKGADTRNLIGDSATRFGSGIRDQYTSLKNRVIGNQEIEEAVAPEVPHFTHKVPKKRKSDIKELIEEAHHHESAEHHEG